jgi:streptogramin lyase
MFIRKGNLYSMGGGWVDGGEFSRPGCSQWFLSDKQEWKVIDNIKPLTGSRFLDATCIAFDPKDESHYFISTCGTGLYEFKDTVLLKNYDQSNSPITSALNPEKYPNVYMNYVRVDGLFFDENGYLWMTCSAEYTNKNSLLRLNPTTGEWKTYNNDELFFKGKIFYILRHAIKDNKGCFWISNDHNQHPCLLRIDANNETITRYDNFFNQDGITYSIHYVHGQAEDLDGNIWIATDAGLFMYTEAQINDPTSGFTQIKVPRNDGSDYADYLLNSLDIACITVDGANRKWIGTNGNGVYLISADNLQQLQHFTFENSPLLSNTIESITINGTTGEVFFGTKDGLCSYMSDATNSADSPDSDDVYAFPNPVPKDYNGLITIRGLSRDDDIKILNANGKLIAQGRSNGGTFIWNGCDSKGNRVASGIYMVATAMSNGNKGVICKIAIVR